MRRREGRKCDLHFSAFASDTTWERCLGDVRED
jgi:hypothetical protein